MKVSLISPLFKESASFEPTLQDLKSFFARFPLEIELVTVIHHKDKETLEKVKAQASTKEFFILPLEVKSRSRAKAIKEGLKKANGDVLLIFSWDLSIPLAEFFNFIQEIFQNPALHIVTGNRFDPKKRNISVRSSWHSTLNQIITEKLRKDGWKLSDPLTPFVGIRSFNKELLEKLDLKGWYYTPAILEWAHNLNWKIEEVSVVSKQNSDRQKTSKIPLVKEFLRHLF